MSFATLLHHYLCLSVASITQVAHVSTACGILSTIDKHSSQATQALAPSTASCTPSPDGRYPSRYTDTHHHVPVSAHLANKPHPSSLAVAKGCHPKATLHLTDQAVMLSLMQRNTALNSLESSVAPSVYDWGQPTPTGLPTQPDVILAADCIYFEPAFPLLLSTLQDLIGERTVCYFACVKRRKADAQFMKSARKVFDVRVVEDDPFEEEWKGMNSNL